MVPLARCLSGQETIVRQRDLDPVEVLLRVDARFRVALHKSRDSVLDYPDPFQFWTEMMER